MDKLAKQMHALLAVLFSSQQMQHERNYERSRAFLQGGVRLTALKLLLAKWNDLRTYN